MQINEKKSLAKKDEKKMQSLTRLGDIAWENTNEAIRHMKSYEGKTEELGEIRKLVVQLFRITDFLIFYAVFNLIVWAWLA
jgi:hypothetical protein